MLMAATKHARTHARTHVRTRAPTNKHATAKTDGVSREAVSKTDKNHRARAPHARADHVPSAGSAVTQGTDHDVQSLGFRV